MTVPVDFNTRTEAVGNGVSTIFPYDFLCLEAGDMQVSINGEPVPVGHYSVNGLANQQGGDVVFVVPPASGGQILMELAVVPERAIDYQNNGDLHADTLNFDFDRIWLAIRSAYGWIRRGLMLGPNDIDGQGAYRARGNRITNLGDSKTDTDAVNRRSMFSFVSEYVDRAIAGVSGGFGFFLQSGAGAVARTFQDKMRELVSVKDFGAKGDYVTDDTAAIRAAIDAAVKIGGVLWFPQGVYRCTDGITIPAGLYVAGAGSPIMGTFPTHQDDKRFLRPGYKNQIPGACLIFSGAGAATATTVRGAPYNSFTFAVRMIGNNAPARWEGVGVVMDMDVLDAAGNVTFAADDHRSNYDVGFFIDDSVKGHFEANIFGYWKVAGVLNYGNDPDQNVFRNGASSGERGFVNLATGDAGLSGTNLDNWNLFANDHHKRDPVTAQWGTSAFEVNSTNGYMVSGVYVRGGRINTYCETPVILNDAREVWFDQTVMELPYYDSPGARDTKFIGNASCDRIGFVGCRWSGTNPIYGADRLAGLISGSIFLYGGAAGINPNAAVEVLHGGQVARIRVSDSGPDLQLGSSYATSTSGVRLRRNPADGTLGIMFDGTTRAIVNDAGVVSSSGGQAGKTGASSAASPALMPYAGDLASGIYRAPDLMGLSINGVAAAVWTPTAHRPGADNTQSLGRSDLRFTTAYLTSNPVVTSDAREKEQIGELPDAWLDAWGDTRLVRFKWIDRVALKGDRARFHIGVVSQEFRDALIARGVDPEEVAAWCRDEWADEYEDVLETVSVEQPDGTFADEERPTGERRLVRASGDRLGLREVQCLFLNAAFERRERVRLAALVGGLAERVEALEAR